MSKVVINDVALHAALPAQEKDANEEEFCGQ